MVAVNQGEGSNLSATVLYSVKTTQGQLCAKSQHIPLSKLNSTGALQMNVDTDNIPETH